MLYTCYFKNQKMLEMEDCVYMSIAVGNPKYSVPYPIVDCRILKPYGIFGQNISDEEYIRLYKQRLDSIGLERIMDEINRLANGHKNVVLLCHEKNAKDCHRRDFADWFYAKTGVIIQEIGQEEKVEKKKEKEVVQMTIFDIM